MRCILAAAALVLVAHGAEARQYDIPWFVAHPGDLRGWLHQCADDYALANTAECANARAANMRRGIGTPLPSTLTPWERANALPPLRGPRA